MDKMNAQRANEQMLVELTATLHDSYEFLDSLVLKNNISSVFKNYEVIKLDNVENELDLLEKIYMYLSAKRIEGLSPRTLEGYEMELKLFTRKVRKHTRDIFATDIRAYLSDIKGIKLSTLAKKLSTLKSFFAWLAAEEIIRADPCLKVKLPKLEKKLPVYLDIEELEYLRECCSTKRERALVEVLYCTGCRLSEIQALNIGDVDKQGMSCVVYGKGSKERVVYFSHKSMYHLEKYLASRKGDEEALFTTERKPYRRMTNPAIQQVFRKLAKKSGLEGKLSPHALRRTFASLTLNNGAELAAVQSLLGHSSPQTTLRYCHVTEDKKKEQHKKFLVQ